jgi:hypothetical protein
MKVNPVSDGAGASQKLS